MSRPLLVSASYDQNIRLWDVVTASPVESFAHKESQVNVMQFSPDGCQLAVAGWQHIRIYDIQVSIQHVNVTFEVNDEKT